jgi:hypothetical protein
MASIPKACGSQRVCITASETVLKDLLPTRGSSLNPNKSHRHRGRVRSPNLSPSLGGKCARRAAESNRRDCPAQIRRPSQERFLKTGIDPSADRMRSGNCKGYGKSTPPCMEYELLSRHGLRVVFRTGHVCDLGEEPVGPGWLRSHSKLSSI